MVRKQFLANICKARMAMSVALVLLAAQATGFAQGGTYALLHSFSNSPDGDLPNPTIQDAQGNLYGTTRGGGTPCVAPNITCGTVFKLDANGNETVLYTFQGGSDGAYPVAALIQDAAGNLYGNTEGNGEFGALSTVFKLDPSGHETVLYAFDGQGPGGEQDSPLAMDKNGNLYDTSPWGGDVNCGYQGSGCGSMYRLTQAGKMTTLHIFKGTDGMNPEGGLVIGADGDLYGTTVLGGNLSCYTPAFRYAVTLGCGTIFKLDSSGKETVLHVFTGKADGSAPLGLIRDQEGNLYGIASYGGDSACYEGGFGCGTIFRVDKGGKFSVLFTFTPEIMPEPLFARHLLLANGSLYGVNQIGGANFSGFIFRLDSQGTFTTVFSFPSTIQEQDGNNPQGVTMDSSGNFYGSMLTDGFQGNDCGVQGCGTVFKVSF
jgi:uncharacterized repeat protein (TIGR03803 family)